MGTTLTGTTPQDTYDSLIKVTDNGPLSGTLKKLTDGLGNDSSLSLSTAAASIAGTTTIVGGDGLYVNSSAGDVSNIFTSPSTHGLFIDYPSSYFMAIRGAAEYMRINSSGNVGIGTSAPSAELQVNKASDVTLALSNSSAVTSGNRGSLAFYNSGISTVALIKATAVTDNVGTQLEFYTRPAAGSLAQTMTIASAGNVGIGTSNPLQKLEVVGSYVRLGASVTDNSNAGAYFQVKNGATIVGQSSQFVANNGDWVLYTGTTSETEKIRVLAGGGLTFNGDTAAANALDDYEEGTWTMGISFGGASVGVTYTTNTGNYTKVGRQVHVTGWLRLSSKGSSTGVAAITGLPFTVGASNPFYSAPSFRLFNVTYTGTLQGYGATGGTTIPLESISDAGTLSDITNSDIVDNSAIMISFTYFV